MRLINKKATLEYFTAPGPKELEEWCREKGYGGVNPTRDLEHDDMPSDHILAAALWHAKSKYPDADSLDVCSYAGLAAYFATGWYGGFDTEHYEKERQAENIILTLAGGMAAPPKGTPTIEFTYRVLEFLDTFYFGNQEQAMVDLLGNVDNKTAAQVILSLAQTMTEYHCLAKVADGFLRKKENISSLREAVRKVLKIKT